MVKIIRKRQQKNRLHHYRSQIVELKAEIERCKREEGLHVGEYLLYHTLKGIGIRHRSGEGGVFDSGLFEQKVKEFFGEHF